MFTMMVFFFSKRDNRYLALSKVVTATGFTGAGIRLVLDQVESTGYANFSL